MEPKATENTKTQPIAEPTMERIKQSSVWREDKQWNPSHMPNKPNPGNYTPEARERIIDQYEGPDAYLDTQHLLKLASSIIMEVPGGRYGFRTPAPTLYEYQEQAKQANINQLKAKIDDLENRTVVIHEVSECLTDALSAENRGEVAKGNYAHMSIQGTTLGFRVNDWEDYETKTREKLDILTATKVHYERTKLIFAAELQTRTSDKRAAEFIAQGKAKAKQADALVEKIVKLAAKCRNSGFKDKKAAREYLDLCKERDTIQLEFAHLHSELQRYLTAEQINAQMPAHPRELTCAETEYESLIRYCARGL